MNYDVDYFIKVFKKIPERKWTKNQFTENKKILGVFPYTACCANAHIGCKSSKDGNERTVALQKILSQLKINDLMGAWRSENYKLSITAVNINDGFVAEYQQPTPKQRILAALYDIKKMQEPKQPEVVYKVVEVDRKVKELVKEERILN